MADPLRIANCSGFYGDRFDAFREVLTGGPVDVITGDYLAELTMLILWRSHSKDGRGYAKTFLSQVERDLDEVARRGVKVVVNAGGLAPAAMAEAVRERVAAAGLDLQVAHIEGDDLLNRMEELTAAGNPFTHLDTGRPFADHGMPALTSNAYLGGWGIATALERGADIVICPRVTDAALVVGPAAWRFGWARDDWDTLAGAVVAGHVIECGAQATGGNYPFFTEIPGLEHPGFPIAEVHADGSSVITKHPGTGGAVTVGTVTAQLLYEIGPARYLNPDVISRFDTIQLTQEDTDRVRISGVRGEPPTTSLKVCINTLGGFRNQMTFVLTGLDIDAKADLVRDTLEQVLPTDQLDDLDIRLVRSDHADAQTNVEATAQLIVTVKARDPKLVDRRAFAGRLVELALATYPGATFTTPPQDASPYGVYWPALVDRSEVDEVVVDHDGTRTRIDQTAGSPDAAVGDPDVDGPEPTIALEPTRRVPLGTIAGARSGDKGGNANIGLWGRTPEAAAWLAQWLTEDRVRDLLPEAHGLGVTLHPLPNLGAVNVVVHGLLGEGVSSSTRPDPQAKGLGEYVRSRLVDVPAALLDQGT
jgi:hypothetical protein